MFIFYFGRSKCFFFKEEGVSVEKPILLNATTFLLKKFQKSFVYFGLNINDSLTTSIHVIFSTCFL